MNLPIKRSAVSILKLRSLIVHSICFIQCKLSSFHFSNSQSHHEVPFQDFVVSDIAATFRTTKPSLSLVYLIFDAEAPLIKMITSLMIPRNTKQPATIAIYKANPPSCPLNISSMGLVWYRDTSYGGTYLAFISLAFISLALASEIFLSGCFEKNLRVT